MENIAPSRALARRSRQLLQIGFSVLAIGVLLVVVGVSAFIIQLLPPAHRYFQLYHLARSLVFGVGVLVFLLGIGMIIRAFTRRQENDLAMVTGDFLSRFFDRRYSFIRNINRPGLGYIDAVLVGTPGVLVFRILDNVGAFANEGASWLKHNAAQEWIPWRVNPTREAVVDVEHVKEYLTKHKLGEVPVYGVIVFVTEPAATYLEQKSPAVPVTHLVTLVDTLRDSYLRKEERITQQDAIAVRHLLLDDM